MSESTHTGRIQFYNVEKQFGFIIADNGTDVYFGRKNLRGGYVPLQDDEVKFTKYAMYSSRAKEVWLDKEKN